MALTSDPVIQPVNGKQRLSRSLSHFFGRPEDQSLPRHVPPRHVPEQVKIGPSAKLRPTTGHSTTTHHPVAWANKKKNRLCPMFRTDGGVRERPRSRITTSESDMSKVGLARIGVCERRVSEGESPPIFLSGSAVLDITVRIPQSHGTGYPRVDSGIDCVMGGEAETRKRHHC